MKFLLSLLLLRTALGGLRHIPSRNLEDEPIPGFDPEELCGELLDESFGDEFCTCEVNAAEEYIVICDGICESCDEELDVCTDLVQSESRYRFENSDGSVVSTWNSYTYDQTGSDSSNRIFTYREEDGECFVEIDHISCKSCTFSEDCEDPFPVFDCSNIVGVDNPIFDTCDSEAVEELPSESPFYGYVTFDLGQCLNDMFDSTPSPSGVLRDATESPTSISSSVPEVNQTMPPEVNTTMSPTNISGVNMTLVPEGNNTLAPTTAPVVVNMTNATDMNATLAPTNSPTVMNVTTNMTMENPMSNETMPSDVNSTQPVNRTDSPTAAPVSIMLYNFSMKLLADSVNETAVTSSMEQYLKGAFGNNTVGVYLFAVKREETDVPTAGPDPNVTEFPETNNTSPPGIATETPVTNATEFPSDNRTEAPIMLNTTNATDSPLQTEAPLENSTGLPMPNPSNMGDPTMPPEQDSTETPVTNATEFPSDNRTEAPIMLNTTNATDSPLQTGVPSANSTGPPMPNPTNMGDPSVPLEEDKKTRQQQITIILDMYGEAVFSGVIPSASNVTAMQVHALGNLVNVQNALDANPFIGDNVTVASIEINDTPFIPTAEPTVAPDMPGTESPSTFAPSTANNDTTAATPTAVPTALPTPLFDQFPSAASVLSSTATTALFVLAVTVGIV